MNNISSPIRATFCFATFLIFTTTLVLIQSFFLMIPLKTSQRIANKFPKVIYNGVCKILSIRIEKHGNTEEAPPIFFVSNHSSYLDIIVLGALIDGSFIAKAEVKKWPFFGWVAKVQKTIFLDRKPSEAAKQKNYIMERLEEKESLILFPEGTSNDGNHVLPFKSSLFGVTQIIEKGTPLSIQPVSISYINLDGVPMGRFFRPYYSWYGDMDLSSHIWRLLGLGKLTVRVDFHEAIELDKFSSRKEMAEYCQKVVSDGVSNAIASARPRPRARKFNRKLKRAA